MLWVHASNAARFEQSYRDIADRVKISGRQNPKANIFKLVHDWLYSSKDQWLLVLDNVDDAHFLMDIPIVQRDGAANSESAPKTRRCSSWSGTISSVYSLWMRGKLVYSLRRGSKGMRIPLLLTNSLKY